MTQLITNFNFFSHSLHNLYLSFLSCNYQLSWSLTLEIRQWTSDLCIFLSLHFHMYKKDTINRRTIWFGQVWPVKLIFDTGKKTVNIRSFIFLTLHFHMYKNDTTNRRTIWFCQVWQLPVLLQQLSFGQTQE